MPYVPVFGPKNRRFPFTEITRSKGSGNKWTETIFSSFRDRTAMAASAVRAGGPHSIMPFGLWAPARPYVRIAQTGLITKGPEFLGNAARIEDCTVTKLRLGYPISDPTTTQLLLPTGSGETGGLVSSGTPVVSPDLSNRLIAECMRKVGDRKIDLGESIAEGRKTLSHIASTASQVLGAYKALRSGNIPRALRELKLSKKTILNGKTFSERWLELQYGWYPLLADIFSAADVLQTGVQRKSYIVSAVRQLTRSGPYRYQNKSGTVNCTYRCKLFYTVSSQDLDALARFGFINPAEVAWALMPYSFVIDWFAPIGALLEAYSATMGLTFLDGHITSRAQIRARGLIESPLSWYYLDGNRFELAFDHFGMRRQVVLTATPLPYVKSPFSSTHLISAIALLRQLR